MDGSPYGEIRKEREDESLSRAGRSGILFLSMYKCIDNYFDE